jgi:hypothetical protein
MLLMRHIGEFPFARCDGTTLRSYGEVGLNFPQCTESATLFTPALKTVLMPVTLGPRHDQGVDCANMARIIRAPLPIGKRVISFCPRSGRFSPNVRDDKAACHCASNAGCVG